MALTTEFGYYLDHHQAWAERWDGLWLVIVGTKIKGVYKEYYEAMLACVDKGYSPDSFLLIQCSGDVPSEYPPQ